MINDITIIIPAYNCEKTIERCLMSIVNQSKKNFNIIIIDDGSTDNTNKICSSYCEKYNFINYIYKQNGGVSSARNMGLQFCKTEYVCFVDSDDTIEQDYLKRLYDSIKIHNYDLVVCGWNNISNKIRKSTYITKKYDNYDEISEFLYDVGITNFINPPWNKIYKMGIISKNKITFDNNISLGEDLKFNLEYIQYSKKIKTIKDELYNYFVDNKMSLSKKYNSSLWNNEKDIFLEYCNIFHSKKFILLDESRCNYLLFKSFKKTILLISISNLSYIKKKKEISKVLNDNDLKEVLKSIHGKSKYDRLILLLAEKKYINILFFILFLRKQMSI